MASTLAAAPAADVPSSTPANSALPAINQNMALVKCNWTEHISPEGFKYYYNSVTGESRVGIYLSCHYFSYFNYTCGTNVHWNQPTVGET